MSGYDMKNKYVLCRRLKNAVTMRNSILVADVSDSKKKVIEAEIVDADKSLKLGANLLAVFPLYAADEFQRDEETLLVVKFQDIMMIESTN